MTKTARLSRRALVMSAGALTVAPLLDGITLAASRQNFLRYISFVVRADGLSHPDFTKAFLAQGEAAAKLGGVAGLVFSEVTANSPPFALSGIDLDGLVEIWVKSEADYQAMMASPAGRKWWAATDALFSRVTTFLCKDHAVRPPKERDGVEKKMTLIVRKDGWTHEAFLEHWFGTHAPLATKVDALGGFVLLEVLRAESSKGGRLMPEVDGISEGWGAIEITPEVKRWFADGDIFIQRDKSRNLTATAHVLKSVP